MNTSKFLFVAVALAGCGTDGTESVAPKAPATIVLRQPTLLVPPSEDEQRRFWEQNLHAVVIDQLMVGNYQIPKIAERFAYLWNMVAMRYQEELWLSLVTMYNPASKAIRAGAVVHNGVPTVELVIPAIMDEFNEVRLTGDDDWMERSQLSVVISVIHEMEHLAGDDFGADLVTEEARAWHLTCLYVLAPLVEIYGLDIGSTAHVYYRLWIEAGRSEGPAWTEAVGSIYNQIEGG